ncbi:MAG: putative photosynthetic complex assembly protein PuhE [Pseudomonadota bacterium]
MTALTVVYALFLWWFSTGAILFVISRPAPTDMEAFRKAVILAVPILSLGAAGILISLEDQTVQGAFIAFTAARLVWGWFEMAFLAGVITGPEVRPSPPDLPAGERFLRAWGAIAHSEMALVMTAAVLAIASVGASNRVAILTFLVLFFARISAKLNVYFGVPNINDEFLPGPVRHLTSHFRRAPMNAFFPWSVTALTFATACWAERAWAAPEGSGAEVGYVLLATLTALAVFEHWMMVLSLPDAALWRWLLPSPTPNSTDIKPDS